MKRVVFMVIIASVLFSSYCPMVNAQKPVGPRLVIDKKVFNANKVKEGEIIDHTFIVSNTGDSVLEINKVQPG